MEAADWHTFQGLTKRSSLMVRYLRARYGSLAPPHIWLGVSVEDAKNTVAPSRCASLCEVRIVRAPTGARWQGRPHRNRLGNCRWRERSSRATYRRKNGQSKSVTNVGLPKSHSFSNNGGIRPKFGGRLLCGREWNQYPAVPRHKILGLSEKRS
jgi:protein gp37